MSTVRMTTVGMVACVALALCLGCSSTKLATWQASDAASYTSIMVFAMFEEFTVRTQVENEVARALGRVGASALTSLSVVSPEERKLEDAFDAWMEKTDSEAILVIRPKDVEDVYKSVPDTTYVLKQHVERWWETTEAMVISEKEARVGARVTIESALYSGESQRLVWKAESTTMHYDDVRASARDFGGSLAKALEKDGLIAKD